MIAIDRDKSREFTLQLLVENVTKHNVISARNPMNVSVTFGPESITVSKPVRLKETDNSTGLIFYPTGVKIRFYA